LIPVIAVAALGLICGAYIIFIHVGADSLTVSQFRTGADSLTVSQFRTEAASLQEQTVNVKGTVVSGSINWNEETKTIEFALADSRESLNVVYSGVVPDLFKPGVEIEVTGKYRPDDIFEAGSFGGRKVICTVCH
jgi:cytochrome c-type biogenesis protein CcmE